MAAARERTRERAVEMERLGGTGERLGGSGERLAGAMERFGGAGMALLPWTRHMIAVLWDQLRLLVQVIYYTFISVFQMFRFEVHVRITDDPSATPDPSDLLFSSLFSEEGGADHAEALLSSLRGEELCCDGEGGIYIGHKRPSSWSATVGDWNFFVSSSETRSSDEERSAASCWSSEEEHLEFDCDESKALWESLSRSGDPYDPFCFSACISTHSKALWETESRALCEREESEASWETESRAPCEREESEASWETESRAPCEREESEASWESDSCSPAFDGDDVEAPPAGRFWESSSEESSDAEDSSPEDPSEGSRSVALVKRSDSDCSWSSDSSENSENSESAEEKEQNRLLWDLFTNSDPHNPLCFNSDPYNPLCFSAAEPRAERTSSSEEEEEELWGGLSKERDPYHPLNFSAAEPRAERRPRSRGQKPELTQRRLHKHQHPQVTVRPWTRARRPQASPAPQPQPQPHGGTPQSTSEKKKKKKKKKVRFSDELQVHVMRSWDFARRSCRRGPWEELARDRDRFRRRVQEAERTVGACLRAEHRERARGRTQPGPDED